MSYTNQPYVGQPTKSAFEYENEWAYGFCECCTNCKFCCAAFFCPFCFECCLLTDAREFICTSYMYPGAIGNLRTKIRSSYRIKGGLDKDKCAVCCCPCCAMIQMKNELVHQGEASGLF